MAYVDIDILDVLKPTTLTDVYVRGQKGSALFEKFDAVTGQNFDDEFVKVPVMSIPQTQMKFGKVGDAAKPLDTGGIDFRTSKSVNPSGHFSIALDKIKASGQYDTAKLALQQVAANSAKLVKAKEISLAKTLLDGKIYLNGDGEIIESAPVATIDHSIPATQSGNLNGIVDKLWSDPTASIFKQLDLIKMQAQVYGSPEPKFVFCNSSVKTLLRANTEAMGIAKASFNISQETWNGSVIDLNGFTWIFVDQTYPLGGSPGVQTKLIPDSRAIICPDPNEGDWFQKFVGAKVVPTDLSVTSIDNLFEGATTVYGDYAYATPKTNPTGVEIVMGSRFLHAIVDKYAVYSPTII
jgi:hypothetical protein